MTWLKRQACERDAGEKVLTSIVYKDSMKSHSKYQEINELEEDELGNLSMNLNTSFERLNDSEIDED